MSQANDQGWRSELLDVLIVGGGIVGAGIARDASIRGLRVGLVEQRDFAFGTSSRSSRLLHGGLRYLAQGRIGMVREASREKRILHRIAPHLAQPLAFIFPSRQGTEWPKWKLRFGVKMYDLLCGGQNLGRSSSLSVNETIDLLPGLSQDGLTGAVRYFDGLTHDARLVIDTLRSAARHGATLKNYSRFLEARRENKQWICTVESASAEDRYVIRSRSVVNATGPWSDKLEHSRTRLRPTKGVHLVVDHSRLAIPDAVVLPEGKRVLFAIPWGQRVILGTTDTDYDGPLDAPQCNVEDIEYVLRVVGKSFPGAELSAQDVRSTWAGLRPLVADPRGGPSDVSRRHEIRMTERAWWDITGGKLTTYRLMAEQLVDQIVRWLGRGTTPSRTAELLLLDPMGVDEMSQIVPPPVSQRAVHHYVDSEWAVHLDDVMVRRTSWSHYHDNQLKLAQQVADWMAPSLNWDDVTKQEEITRYLRSVPTSVAGG